MAKGTLNDPVRIAKRIRKFTSRDHNRPILCGIHLDECGDVVATDSYRLFIEHGAWEGPNIELPTETLDELTKLKIKGNDTATIEYESKGEVVKTELSSGERFVDSHPGGTFPKYKALCGSKVNTIAYVKTKELLPVVREHIKLNQTVLIDVTKRDLRVRGVGDEPLPEYRVEKACDGIDNEVTLNATFLRDALSVCGEVAEIRIESHIKPVTIVDGSTEIVVMPVRMIPTKATTKKAERKPKPEPEKIDTDKLARALYRQALDRAANDPDSRVKGGNATDNDRNMVWQLMHDGLLDKRTVGDFTSWYVGDLFICCIETRWSKRKIHLHYPPCKPVLHDTDKAAELSAKFDAERIERAAKKKAGANVKATVNDMGDGVTAIVIEPKKEEPNMELKKRIEELEAELAKRNAELEEVWKENEQLKRSKPEPKPEPEPKVEPKADVPTAITLEAMTEWCKERGLKASQKHPGSTDCIWVHGVMREDIEYRNELVAMGFRPKKEEKSSWWFKPAAR